MIDPLSRLVSHVQSLAHSAAAAVRPHFFTRLHVPAAERPAPYPLDMLEATHASLALAQELQDPVLVAQLEQVLAAEVEHANNG